MKKKRKNRDGGYMSILSKKGLLVFSIAILSVQVLLIPLNILNAETMEDQEVTQKQEEVAVDQSYLYDGELFNNSIIESTNNLNEEISDPNIPYDEKDQDIPNIENNDRKEEQRFTIDQGDLLEVDKNSYTTIKASSEIETNRLSVNLSSGIFIIENEEFSIIDVNESEGQIRYILEYTIARREYELPIYVQNNGWIMIADEKEELHGASTIIEIENTSRIGAQRVSVTVFNWINFQAWWNNNAVTTILLDTSRNTVIDVPANASLNTRTAGVEITNSLQTSNVITGHLVLPWSNGLVHINSIGVENLTVRGADLRMTTAAGYYITTTGKNQVQNFTHFTGGSLPYSTPNEEYPYHNQGEMVVSGTLQIGTLNSNGAVNNGSAGFLTDSPIQAGNIVIAPGIHLSIKSSDPNSPVLSSVNLRMGNSFGTIVRIGIFHLGNVTNTVNYSWRGGVGWVGNVNNGVVSNPVDPTFNNSTFDLTKIYWIVYTTGSGGGWVEPPVEPATGNVTVNYIERNGDKLADSEIITGPIGEPYITEPKTFENFQVRENPSNSTGLFTADDITVTYVYDELGKVIAYYRDEEGNNLHDPISITGIVDGDYETTALEFEGYSLIEQPDNASGQIVSGTTEVHYRYRGNNDDSPVNPVDPLEPEVEVDPENKPELPEDQGLLSIDFASSFNFGEQTISVQDKTYYAQPQRLLNTDGTVNESEERPNYVQISDRRSENERNGWQLAVTQKEQFHTQEGNELDGARLRFTNQQLATAQGGEEPELLHEDLLTLVPGMKQPLLRATSDNGTGTWIYRFGDRDTADESVALEVPSTTSPEAKVYSTTLTWELSSVPGND